MQIVAYTCIEEGGGHTKGQPAVRYIYQLERVSVLHIYLLSWLLERKSVFHCPEPLMALFFLLLPLPSYTPLTQQHMCTTTTYTCYPPSTTSLIQWFIAFKQLFFSPSVDGLCYCCVSLRANNRFLQSGIILIGSTFFTKYFPYTLFLIVLIIT